MTDNKNTILAIVLSALVLIAWQYFVGMPQEKARQEQLQQQQLKQQTAQQQAQPAPNGQATPAPGPQAGPAQIPGQNTATAEGTSVSRADALAASPRVQIDTPTLQGSIALKGARIDDVALVKFRETVDPKSPPIFLLSPNGTADPFYAEFGWAGGAGSNVKVPTADTVWTQVGTGGLSVGHPVTLSFDNGQGLEFRRTISIDDKYLFTIKDEVVNKGTSPVTLYPYGLISRHGTPHTQGYYILHEGLIGFLGDDGLKEYTYKNMMDLKPDAAGNKTVEFNVTNGWLGITDKYWAATLLPDTTA